MVTTGESLAVKRRRINRSRPSVPCYLSRFKAARLTAITGRVAKHQPVPGPGFVEPAHRLTQVGQSLVQFGMRRHTQAS